MIFLLAINWSELFVPTVPFFETFVRGSVVYLFLFFLIRLLLKREAGTVNMADLLMIVIIADASQNAMAANYQSITDGIILVSTIIFWNSLLDMLAYHVPVFQRLVHPSPIVLVKDGQIIWRNMRRELVTQADLMSAVRQSGIKDLSEVQKAHLEGDGRISVISYDSSNSSQQDSGRRGGI